MRRLIAAGFLLAVCAAALLLAGASSDGGVGKRYNVVFDNAFGLVEGGDVKVGGVRAGRSKRFTVSDSKPPKAIVEVQITEPGFDSFRADATCGIKPQSLIGEYFIDCQPGSSPQKLRNGGTIPVEQTEGTIPVDLINNVMRLPYRERLRLIISELGAGLAGRPQDLAEVLRRAHPGLRETSKVLRILGNQDEVIKRFISDSDTVIEELEANKRDVARWVDEAGETAEISATRRADIARSFRRLPTFLGELEPTMRRLGQLADEQTPLLRDLRRAAPHLETTFRRLGPFAEASRPAIDSLGEASQVGERAIEASDEEIRELRNVARDAPAVAKPLSQFLLSLDDRNRAVERDPRANLGTSSARAGPTDPPAPDPTHLANGRPRAGGFTGFEAFWNYAFWQTLAINSGDAVGHALKVALIIDEGENGCSPYSNYSPDDRGRYDKCKIQLGPDQPGTEDPDPTNGQLAGNQFRGARQFRARSSARRRERAADGSQPSERDAGDTEPGARSASAPQRFQAPDLSPLLERLGLGARRSAPAPAPRSSGQPAPNQLLDYLLGP